MYTYFIGVDVRKDTLDIVVVSPANALLHERRIANKKTVIVAFF